MPKTGFRHYAEAAAVYEAAFSLQADMQITHGE